MLSFRPPGGPPVSDDAIAKIAGNATSSSQERYPYGDPSPSGARNDQLDDVLSVLGLPNGDIFPSSDPFPWVQRDCDREGCSYRTSRIQGSNAHAVAAMDIEMHNKQFHAESVGSQVFGNLAQHSFTEATRKVTVKEQTDNRSSILHEVRTWPGILDAKVGAKMQPPAQQFVNCYPDFGHLGIRLNLGRVLQLIHDRTCQTIKLKMFSKGNLLLRIGDIKRKTNVVPGGFVADGELDTLANIPDIGEALIAADNYDILMSWVHPLDFGPKAIVRVIKEKIADNKVKKVTDIVDFFEGSVLDNACRIARREIPMTHTECIIKWDQTVGPSMGNEEVMLETIFKLEKRLDMMESRGVKRTSISQNQGRRNNPKVGPTSTITSSGATFCLMFNTRKGCTNQLLESGTGCVDKRNREFKHGCKFPLGNNEFCNNTQHNKFNHV